MRRISVVKLLEEHKQHVSFSQTRRLLEQGAVRLNGKLLTETFHEVVVVPGDKLQVGRKEFVIGAEGPGGAAKQ